MRKTYYDQTGRCPRSLKQAFGPYTNDSEPKPILSDSAVFACACVIAVLTVIFLIYGVI